MPSNPPLDSPNPNPFYIAPKLPSPATGDDIGKRLIALVQIIRPPLPPAADYSLSEKARMFDDARNLLYNEDGSVRPLRMSRGKAALLILGLSTLSWGAIIAMGRAGKGIVGSLF